MDAGFSTVRDQISPTGERILIDAEGNRVIAATRRPDGSLRKEMRIRKGFAREEEKNRFVTKGTEFRKNVEEFAKVPVGFIPTDASSSQPLKKKKKTKKTENVLSNIPPPVIETFSVPLTKRVDDSSTFNSSKGETDGGTEVQINNVPNFSNRLRNVKKRLVEIEELEKKKAAGETLKPEQLKKIGRRKQAEKEVHDLEESIAAASQ